MKAVLVCGDVNVDVLTRLPAPLIPGGDNLVADFAMRCGGVGANTAIALAKWGVSARLLACVGRDWFGDFAITVLADQGMDVAHLQRTGEALTGLIFIPIDPDGQRTILGSRGANARLSLSHSDFECLDGVSALHLVGYPFLDEAGAKAMELLATEAKQRGLRVSLDIGLAPAQQAPQRIQKIFPHLRTLFVTKREAEALTGRADSRQMLAALADLGIPEIIVKAGPRGSIFKRADNKWTDVPALRVEAVDTTGAGDAFAAAYLYARSSEWLPAAAVLLANAAGAAASTVVGAGDSMPALNDVLELLERSRMNDEWEPQRIHALELLRSPQLATSAQSKGR